MSLDLMNNVKGAVAIAPAQLTASTNGATVNAAGYEAVGFVIVTGVAAALTGANYFTATVESSADGSAWAAVSTDDYVVAKRSDGTAWDRLLDNAGDASSAFVIGVRSKTDGFFRLVLTETGAADAFVSASAVLGHSRHMAN